MFVKGNYKGGKKGKGEKKKKEEEKERKKKREEKEGRIVNMKLLSFRVLFTRYLVWAEGSSSFASTELSLHWIFALKPAYCT